jgi:hypothetical protein
MILQKKKDFLPITVNEEGPSLYCAISEEAKKRRIVACPDGRACLELSRRSGGSLRLYEAEIWMKDKETAN